MGSRCMICGIGGMKTLTRHLNRVHDMETAGGHGHRVLRAAEEESARERPGWQSLSKPEPREQRMSSQKKGPMLEARGTKARSAGAAAKSGTAMRWLSEGPGHSRRCRVTSRQMGVTPGRTGPGQTPGGCGLIAIVQLKCFSS